MGNKGFQGVTEVKKVTRSYKGLQEVKGVTRGYKELQGVTRGNSG